MSTRCDRPRRARPAGRRWGAVAVGALVGVLAVTPTPSGAAPQQQQQAPPQITVTEITGPPGTEIIMDANLSQLTERGHVLVETSDDSEPRINTPWAVWRNGSLTRLVRPPGSGDPGDVLTPDISDRGQVVGTYQTCRRPDERCVTPYVWTDGRPTPILLGEDGNVAARAVNDRGQVLLDVVTPPTSPPPPPGGEDTLVWEDGQVHSPPPSDVQVWGVDINDRGQVAARLVASEEGDDHIGIWRVGGEVVDLGTLPGHSSAPVAINDRGHVIGTAMDAEYLRRAVLGRGGELIDLGTLGGTWSVAVDINEQGEVIGRSETAAGEVHGFLWRGGRMIDLGPIDPAAINNRSQVVGSVPTETIGVGHAVLWQEGRTIDLGALYDPDQDSEAIDINDRGQIIGEAYAGYPVSEDHPLLWTLPGRPG